MKPKQISCANLLYNVFGIQSLLVLVALFLVITANPKDAYGMYLKETIHLNANISDLDTDGINLLVLSYERNGMWLKFINTFNLSGELINSIDISPNHTSGITWNGSQAIVGQSPQYSGSSDKQLYQVDLQTGSKHGPFTPSLGGITGHGFNGSEIAVTRYALGSEGTLTAEIDMFDCLTYQKVETLSVTVDTGTNIGESPVYGTAWHNGDMFLGFQGVNNVYRFDNQLNLVEEISVATTFGPRGLTFIGDDLFVADGDNNKIYQYAVPEPTTLLLLGLGGLVLRRRRQTL